MTLKQKYAIFKIKKYLREVFLEEYARMVSEKPNSCFGFLKKSDKRKKFDDIGHVLDNIKTVPSYLFKYRSCNEANFNALSKNSIWVASAENFIDPYDCKLPFSIKEVSDKKINKLMKWYVFTEYLYTYKTENLSRFDNALTPDEVKKLFFSYCYNSELYLNNERLHKYIKKHYPKNQRDSIVHKIALFDKTISKHGKGQQLRDWYRKDCAIGCTYTIDENRKAKLVCSLTETKNNPKMWEEYADNYKGFCIGYDFSKGIPETVFDNIDSVAVLKCLLPVVYTDQKPKFNSYKYQIARYKYAFYEDSGDYSIPMTSVDLQIQMLIKNSKYSNEQEWRIVVEGDESGLILFPFAKAIYLGKDISERNKDILLKIATENHLNVYQQKVGLKDFEYHLIKLAKPRIFSQTKKIVVPCSDIN